nr:TPA_inf: MSH5 [Sporisorium reilianum f. sp. reilianum]
MSAASHSQALGTASGTNAAASHHRDNDEHSSIVQLAGPVSALAIEVLHGRIGCAVFLDEEQQLLLCEDLPCDFAFHDQAAASSARDTAAPPENVKVGSAAGHEARNVPANSDAWNGYVGSLLSQFDPELIVASSRCPEALLDILRDFAAQRRSVIDVRPATNFQLALGLSSIEEVTRFSQRDADREPPEYTSNDERSLSALVVLDAKVATSKSTLAISSVGPLLSSLRSRREIGRSLTLSSLCLDDHLFVDENTLKSLSIHSSDVHGFVHSKQDRQGFSILVSQPLLKRWIMLPLAKRAEILRRHEAIELFVRLDATSGMDRLRSQLKELCGVPQVCYRLNMGVGTASMWLNLMRTCNAIMNIRAELNSLDLTRSEMLNELKAQVVVDSLLELSDSIANTIDFEDSKSEGKVTVRAGVDTHLDELRELQTRLPVHLDRVAADLKGQPAFRPTTKQIGYLICVRGGEMIDMPADPSLEQQFVNDEFIYLKNGRMSELDHNLGDVASFIVDKEIEILDGLQSMLQQCSPVLLAAHAALCQIDCLVAFARVATMYDLKRPVLVDDQVIRLKGSRHALKALSIESFVPNDIDLQGGIGLAAEQIEQGAAAEDQVGSQRDRIEAQPRPESQAEPRPGSHAESRHGSQGEPRRASQRSAATDPRDTDTKYSVMVLTGANSSGKSCLLQQAALAVYMCQCGSFVPASHAELGVFDKILTRMRQDESVASEGSSFTRELGRLHRAMAMSTSKSLVILDEVGRECRSDDGAGLFIATIYDFLQRGPDCPIVLSATHHLRAIERHLPPTLPIQRAHMQSLLLPTLAEAYNSLTYLYRLRPGFAGTSHACHCARLCGVPDLVVERAERICRIGLRAWHDAEAVQDEMVVRRLLELELGNGGEEGERERMKERIWGEVDDEMAMGYLGWVLTGDGDEEEEEEEMPLAVSHSNELREA